MNSDSPIAIVHAGEAAREWAAKGNVQVIAPDWVVGAFDRVEAAVKSAGARGITINVVWGCGSWGMTQVLAEMARGGWGVVTVPEYVALRPDASMPMDFALDFEWTRIVPLARLAPKTEYTARR